VRAPIDGIPSRNLVDVGNLVDAMNKTHLTTVVAIAPIFVYFDVPEKYVNEARRNQHDREKDTANARKIVVRVATPGDEGYPHEGLVDWADNEVNQDTGTLQARAVFPNENKALYAGVFVRVQIVGKTEPDQVLIEERAIGTDLAGKFILVVVENDVVERRGIKLGQREGLLRVVNEGLTGDERYIVVGQLRARPGMPARPADRRQRSSASLRRHRAAPGFPRSWSRIAPSGSYAGTDTKPDSRRVDSPFQR
jgi:RND family efflux transporter MFP subunit